MKTVEEVIARVLKIDPFVITDDSGPHNLENWDSFNGLLVVTELEKTFNVSFSLEEVIAIKNIGDIKRALEKHGVPSH